MFICELSIFGLTEISKALDAISIALFEFSVTIVAWHDVETRRFDLCPKCRKDFERFMKNEQLQPNHLPIQRRWKMHE